MRTLVIAVLVGAAAALTYFIYLLQSQVTSSGEQVFTFLYLTALFSIGAYLLLVRFVLPRIRTFSHRAQVSWVIVSILTSVFLLIVIPVRLPVTATTHHLEITATGQKNQSAQGSELWVIGLFRADGTQVDNTEFTLNGEWEVRDGVPLSYQHQPATLVWQGELDGDMQLRLLSHPWSGITTVTWDGVVQTIDLYSATGTQKEIVLPVRTEASWQSVTVFIADAITLGALVLGISIWLATRSIQARTADVRRWAWVGYAAPCIAIWSIYLLAFWPGLLSNDSISQWSQLLSGKFDDIFPVVHTLTNWLITRIWLSPAIVAFAQIIALAIVFGLTMQEIEHWRVSRWIRWIITGIFSLSLVNGLMVITLWKDIPYSIITLALFAFLLRTVRTQGAYLKSNSSLVLLWLLLIFLALYRSNGLITTLVMIFFLFWWVKERPIRVRLVLIALACLIGYLVVKGPVFQMLQVRPNTAFIASQNLIHQVSAVVNSGAPLDDNTQGFLAKIQPIENWRDRYSCYDWQPLAFNPQVSWDFFDANFTDFFKIWLRLVFAHPDVIVRHQLCADSMIWRITQPSDGYVALPPAEIVPNDLGLVTRPKLVEIHAMFIDQIVNSQKPSRIWFIWRPALYLYLTLFCIIIAAIRLKSSSVLMIVLPTLIISLSWLVLLPNQDFRFQYPTYLISLIVPALLFAQIRFDRQILSA
jgi:hypothetical protein